MKVFVEEQRFDQWWFRLLMLLASLIIFGTIAVAYPELKSDTAAYWSVLAASGLTFIIIITMLFFVKLKTKIDELGIHYAFYPVHLFLKSILWSEISECMIRKYHPLRDFGGWGYRMGLFRRKGGALNVKGNIGIQIVFKNGKRLLIGTQDAANVEKVLETYRYKFENA